MASRRGFLTALGGLAAGAAALGAANHVIGPASDADTRRDDKAEKFFGAHQAGIVTPAQKHTYFAVFDLTTTKRDDVVALLKKWTDASERMARGETDLALDQKTMAPGPAADSGDALNLTPSRLTLTFGFGPGLFDQRFGLAAKRPEALVDLPRFNGDEISNNRDHGDLSVQACANDPQVAFHAIRQLARLAAGIAVLRWTQTGFLPDTAAGENPRNLMGFKDGTETPLVGKSPRANAGTVDQVVWLGSGAPDWLQGGTYMVVRRIRMAIEHWDKSDLDFQEQVIGARNIPARR